MTDKTRADFEAWFINQGYGMISKSVKGGYEWVAASAAWDVWQTATLAERERCASLVEQAPASMVALRAAIRGVI